jgi:hypothetical protein
VAATAVALLGLFWAGYQVPAYAGINASGRTVTTRTVSSGTFAVIPTTATSGTPSPGAANLSFLVATPNAYFDAVNTGSIGLVAASYNLNMSYTGLGTPTITLFSCPGGAWNQVLNTCPGGSVTIGSWGAGSSATIASTQVPASNGNRLRLRAQVTATGLMVSATAVANVTVSSGPTRQIRAAVTTNA